MSTAMTAIQKALKINLDPHIYGTFAEIGAGQDVAGNFFKAGAASGTVAKSISAYDMKFSDSIYGREKSGRYVCQSRVEKMMDYEYELVIERLQKDHPERCYFAFANTIEARNYQGTNDPHGWLGLKFMGSTNEEASHLLLHVRLHDQTALLQQNTLGALGVNMIYASYYQRDTTEVLVEALTEGLRRENIEIDMLHTAGPAFKNLDNRLLNLQLVVNGFADAIMFDENGDVRLPKDDLYKKNILIARGSYRPPTKVNVDILKTGLECFSEHINTKASDIISVAEITISNLKEDGDITKDDFLARVDLLSTIGMKVFVTNMPQYFKLTEYLSRFKPVNMGLVLGAYNFMQIFDEEYNQLKGGMLEAMGTLFKRNLKVFLYPYREEKESDELISLKTLKTKKSGKHLLEFIKERGQIFDIENYNDQLLHIYSRKVLEMIKTNKEGWEQYVPEDIAKQINEKCLFGHPCEHIIK